MTDDRDPVREHFAALGKKGGPARAKKLPKTVRKAIARLGGQASARALRRRLERPQEPAVAVQEPDGKKEPR
jgi:hypothetical protein